MNNLEWSDNSVEMLSCSDVGDTSGNRTSLLDDIIRAVDTSDDQTRSGATVNAPQPPNILAVEQPLEHELQGTVCLRGKKIEGEVDTTMVIIKCHQEKEITRFKDNVIVLSQTMTQLHPFIFAGPRDGLCKCSRFNGMFIFQYAQLFEGCKQVSNWTVSESPNSVHSFLLQIFLTLKTALDMKLLPTYMTEWRDVLIAKGAVMIDIVSYVSRNFNKSPSSMFSDQCESLVSLCTTMVAKHLPNSELCTRLCELGTGATWHALTMSIEWLRSFDTRERMVLHLLTLDGNVFTFRDYSSDMSNWLTCVGEQEEAHARSSAKLLVYGHPKSLTGDQTAESVGDTKLNTLVRNIALRLKVKIFGSSRLEVMTLDCTQGLTKVTLDNAALHGIPSVNQLDRLRLINKQRQLFHTRTVSHKSKWSPVIMFTKFQRQGPVQEFTVEYYKMTVLMVLQNPQGSVRSLRDLFRSVTLLSGTDY